MTETDTVMLIHTVLRSQEVVGPPLPMSSADSADDMRNKPRRPPRSASKDLVMGKSVRLTDDRVGVGSSFLVAYFLPLCSAGLLNFFCKASKKYFCSWNIFIVDLTLNSVTDLYSIHFVR